jgi:hypothetical protein
LESFFSFFSILQLFKLLKFKLVGAEYGPDTNQ